MSDQTKEPLPPPYYDSDMPDETVDVAGPSSSEQQQESATSSKQTRRYGLADMYRYATFLDKFGMLFGVILALAEGAAFPAALLYYAKILNALITYTPCWEDVMKQVLREKMMAAGHRNGTNDTMLAQNVTTVSVLDDEQIQRYMTSIRSGDGESLTDKVSDYCRDYALIGVGMYLASNIYNGIWTLTGQRQLLRLRTELFRAMLRKDASWFDARRSGALNTVLFEQIRKVEGALTAGVAMTAHFLGVAISGYIVAFVSDWLVSIVIFSLVPLFFFIGFTLITCIRHYTAKQLKAYGRSGTIANEVLGSSRTVLAFNKQEQEVNRYGENLADYMHLGTVKIVVSGGLLGCAYVVFHSMGGLAFWWGNNPQVAQAGGDIAQIITSIMIGSMALVNAMPNFEVIASAVGASNEIFSIIDEEPRIDNFSQEGHKLETIKGDINFEDVAFAYPSRPDRRILKSFTLHIKSGQTVALVGPSGCGKSTTMQMLLRFYDAIAGKVTIDGVNIQDFDVRWLRHSIGLVSQEPVLFNMSIKENIRMGALDRAEVSDDEIIAASKLSNAHNFISILPDGYNTMVGERGAQLSGGQKQRIAIARALISNPKILVLDEATSALDTNSEKVVQEALDNARVGRTTLVIAHRLSTIRNADKICVVDGGVVAELGDHASLMALGGLYNRLVKNQEVEAEKARKQLEEEEEDEANQPVGVETVNIIDETSPSVVHCPTGVSIRSRAKSIHEAEQAIVIKRPEEEEEVGLNRFQLMKTVMKWGQPETKHTIIACLIAVLEGGVEPGFGILIAEFIGSFCPGSGQDRIKMLIGISIGLGVFHAIISSIQHYLFAVIGEQLSKRVRCNLLGKLLRMDASWLDRQENQPSVLTTILATDCADIQGLSGIRLSLHITSVVIVVVAVIYSLTLEYRIALCLCALVPFIIWSSLVVYRFVLHGAATDEYGTTAKDTSIIAMDAINNMRTVMSLGAEPDFLRRFSEKNSEGKAVATKKSLAHCPLLGFLLPAILWCGAITFGLGAYLMDKNEASFIDILQIYVIITICCPAVGRQSSGIADETKAAKAVQKLLKIFNTCTTIDLEDPKTGESLGARELDENKQLLTKPCTGRIEFKNVTFSYPNRPAIKILKGVSFTVEPGQRVALCGTSGGGKSTIIQLVQRLYDADSGSITVDGVDIRQMNVRLLRSNIGLVAQEPALFAMTIRENISYGSRSPSEKPNQQQIDAACKQANVQGFMQKLPDGYNTFVGERGAQLSGGQKQRIAIARALVRNPSILLLDEATSALDTESERIVQDALDLAAHGRTTLTIAHRLSTIQNSDKILVLDQGRVAEQGTHAELMAKQGLYYDLQLAQTKQVGGGHHHRK